MIHEYLLEGAWNAMTSRELCAMLDLTPRELTIAIERERRAGHPICAASGKQPGYYLASTKKEMQDYCGRLRHRAGEIFATRRACLATIDSLPAGEAQ